MRLKAKITVKVGNQKKQPISDFIRKLQYLDIAINTFVVEAADLIENAIGQISVMATLSPSSAMREFKSYFSTIVRNHLIDKANILGSTVNMTTLDAQKDTEIVNYVGRPTGNKVVLEPFNVPWENMIMPSKKHPGEFFYKDVPHVVDHIMCHIKGYKLYENLGKNRLTIKEFIRGRDIIITSVMFAVPDIQQGLKNIVLGVLN